jgi:hypothetical protein
MPNHVYARAYVTGKPEAVSAFLNAVQVRNTITDRTKYDINVLFPNPLIQYKSPVSIVTEKEYREIVKTKKEEDSIHRLTGLPITKKMSDEFKEKYGTHDWYEWAKINWGSKWGFYDFEIIHNDPLSSGEQELCFEVASAWCLPEQLMKKVSEMHPELSFEYIYYEESYAIAGEIEIKAGEVIKDEHVNDAACEPYVKRYFEGKEARV